MCYFSDRQENLKYQLAGEKSGRGQERKEWSVRGEEGETGPWWEGGVRQETDDQTCLHVPSSVSSPPLHTSHCFVCFPLFPLLTSFLLSPSFPHSPPLSTSPLLWAPDCLPVIGSPTVRHLVQNFRTILRTFYPNPVTISPPVLRQGRKRGSLGGDLEWAQLLQPCTLHILSLIVRKLPLFRPDSHFRKLKLNGVGVVRAGSLMALALVSFPLQLFL